MQLPEFHKNFAGLTEVQAELEFVQEAQKLPEYGIHFYKVQYVSSIVSHCHYCTASSSVFNCDQRPH